MTLFSFPPTAEEIADPNLNPPLSHGNCPACKHDLNGGGIWDHFYRQALDEGMTDLAAQTEADRVAEMYGANRTKGRWGLGIGLVHNDRCSSYGCPFCKAIWDRATGEVKEEKLEMPE